MMRISQIQESETSDQAFRDEANHAFDAIRQYISRSADYLEDVLSPSSSLGGSYAMRAQKIGACRPDDDLIIIFSPRQNNGAKGGYGNAGGKPVIMLAVLKGPSDLQYLDTRLSSMRDFFVHEYSHYLAWSEGKSPPVTSAEHYEKGDATGYYNHAEELNAYYHEATSSYLRLIHNVIDLGHGEVIRDRWLKTPAEMVRDIVTKQLNQDFYAALTPENKQRIHKRIARFVVTTIIPLLMSIEERPEELDQAA